MKPLVLFGAGEIAEVAHFYLTRDAHRLVAAFTVDGAFMKEETFRDLPVVPFEVLGERYGPDQYDMFVALSYAKLNTLRADKCRAAKEKGYNLVSYVSSRATTWPGLEVGENCFILEDNTIQPFCRIGNNVTLWSGNHIGHHACIGANCFITSHVVISGGVQVGDNTFIGVNATIRDHVTIGKSSIIGAGSLILQNVPDGSVYTQAGAELSKVPSSRIKKI